MNKQTKELYRINNELNKQVNDENNEALTAMICYLRGANISEYNQEIIRQDLLEMTLSAQKRGDGIQTVVGEDYKVFCDDIIFSIPPRSIKEKLLEFLDIVCYVLSFLGAINIIVSAETIVIIRNFIIGKPLNFNISFSLGSIISSCIVIVAVFIIVKVIIKNAFKIGKNKNANNIKLFFLGVGVMAVFKSIHWLGRATLFTVNIFVVCAVTIALYIVHWILDRT